MLRKVESAVPAPSRIIRPFLRWIHDLRHGENHRANALVAEHAGTHGPFTLRNWELLTDRGFDASVSKLALVDLERAMRVALWIRAVFALNFAEMPCVAVAVKHGNACGAAVATDPVTATRRMIEGHPRAFFGASVVTTFPVDAAIATLLRTHWRREVTIPRIVAGVAAPEISLEARDILKRESRPTVLMRNAALADLNPEHIPREPVYTHLPILGSYVVEDPDTFILDFKDERIRTEDKYGTAFSPQVLRDIALAWAVCWKTKSNATTIVQNGQVLANVGGSVDRVGASDAAGARLADDCAFARPNIVAATDSFFPFTDGLAALKKHHVNVVFVTRGGARERQIAEFARTNDIAYMTLPDDIARGFDH